MKRKIGSKTIDQTEKQLEKKQGIAEALRIVQEFQKIQSSPKEDRQTKFSRYSKGTWESYSYSSQRLAQKV